MRIVTTFSFLLCFLMVLAGCSRPRMLAQGGKTLSSDTSEVDWKDDDDEDEDKDDDDGEDLCQKFRVTASSPAMTAEVNDVVSIEVNAEGCEDDVTFRLVDKAKVLKFEQSVQVERTYSKAGSYSESFEVQAISPSDKSVLKRKIAKITLTIEAAGSSGGGSTQPTEPTPEETPSPEVIPPWVYVQVLSNSQISLTWGYTHSGIAQFRIERSKDGMNFRTLAQPSARTTQYTDTGLAASTKYFYLVCATGKITSATACSAPQGAQTKRATP